MTGLAIESAPPSVTHAATTHAQGSAPSVTQAGTTPSPVEYPSPARTTGADRESPEPCPNQGYVVVYQSRTTPTLLRAYRGLTPSGAFPCVSVASPGPLAGSFWEHPGAASVGDAWKGVDVLAKLDNVLADEPALLRSEDTSIDAAAERIRSRLRQERRRSGLAAFIDGVTRLIAFVPPTRPRPTFGESLLEAMVRIDEASREVLHATGKPSDTSRP